ncbi:YLS9 protein [Spatholobus suberectus]|nr:YLS9 protein [Spatholobus suberectus]
MPQEYHLLQAMFEEQSVINLKPHQLGEYKEEMSVGIYNDLVVDFDLRIRANYGRFGSSGFSPPIVQCHRLSVPLISNGKSKPALAFSVTKCSTGAFFGSSILFWRRPSYLKYYRNVNTSLSKNLNSPHYTELLLSSRSNFIGVAALVISLQIMMIIRILYNI